MNILIADDNKNNRMILSLFLEDYMDDHAGVKFNISEASDGLEAVQACRDKEFDIVLMDIMMPNMDGIEATKIIREEHQKIMIIAVSAVDDTERQRHILNNGAEDYISKPVNSDIFNTRIGNYITLIEARENKVNNNESRVNLYTKEIFSRHTRFIFSNEDAISEFWEYYLLSADDKYENLSDVVRAIFAIVKTQHRLNIYSDLYVEESEANIYFTLGKVDLLPAKIVELLLKKNAISHGFIEKGEKLSFIIPKEITLSGESQALSIEKVVETPLTTTEVAVEEELVSGSLQIYNYIDTDDMYDLEEYVGKLSTLMLMVGAGDVTDDDVTEIYSYIRKLGTILGTYSEVYSISGALQSLSDDIATYSDVFLENSDAFGPLCTAFSKDMTNWVEQSFYTGAPSEDFMNDTIVVNCQTIGGMLKMDEAAPANDDDFDDIFDF